MVLFSAVRKLLNVEEKARPIYSATIQACSNGNAPLARVSLARLKRAAETAMDRSLALEAEVWCLLCEGKPTEARNLAVQAASSSRLLLAIVGVLVGRREGAMDAFASALCETPSIDLVTHVLVACNAADKLATVLESPGVVTHMPDAWLLRASAHVFRSGNNDACERICGVAFDAYGSPIHMYNAACCVARKGDVEAALEYIRYARSIGWNDRASLLRDPDLANLRADPRFAEFL